MCQGARADLWAAVSTGRRLWTTSGRKGLRCKGIGELAVREFCRTPRVDSWVWKRTSTPPPVHPVESALGLIAQGLSELRAADFATLGGAALVDAFDEIVKLHRGMGASYLTALGAVDERRVATDVGAKSTAEWLRLRHKQAGSGRDVAAARATAPGGDLYELGQALADGRVSREHLDVAVRTLGRIPAHLKDEQRGKVAQFLTEQSEQFAPRDFEDVAKALLAVLDPDGAHSFDPDAHQRRSLSMATDATGMLAGRFLLDQIGSAWFSTALQHYAAPDPAACGVDENVNLIWPHRDGLKWPHPS